MIDLNRRWIKNALCAGMDVKIFYAEGAPNPQRAPIKATQAHWNRAKLVCAKCPVQPQCARDTIGEPDGVWGGRDPRERWLLRQHLSEGVRGWDNAMKLRVGRLARQLQDKGVTPIEVCRIIGLRSSAITYLVEWVKDFETPFPVVVLLPGDRMPTRMTDGEKRQILRLHRAGVSTRAIAAQLGRSAPGVRHFLQRPEETAKYEQSA